MANPPDTSPKISPSEHINNMSRYIKTGEEIASNIDNRGPLVLTKNGKLQSDILEAYWEHGFYIFENVIDEQEIKELRGDANNMIERAPAEPGGLYDAKGRKALGRDFAREPYTFIKPLSDPWGGTALLNGRHPTKMNEPIPEKDAPEHIVHLMYGMCEAMPAGLRVYGHPKLLAVAQSINGEDFVPYNDAIFVKQPGLGGSVSWHQDGVTHWESPNWNEGIHGFNFQVQLYPTTPANSLWIVPGSHKEGKIDIKKLMSNNKGSDQLPGAMPLVCNPGSVTLVNRQMLHGSFANTSPDIRISITFGFHRKTSVLGQKAALSMNGSNTVYDEKRIFERSAVIQVAIDARHQHFNDEPTFTYKPFIGLEDKHRFSEETFNKVIKDYNTRDLAI
jgi:ectoine hydroxylase-related dioxygenase (phytanoyl-CoA dioxygenase family)